VKKIGSSVGQWFMPLAVRYGCRIDGASIAIIADSEIPNSLSSVGLYEYQKPDADQVIQGVKE
jgi:hypothetical protein